MGMAVLSLDVESESHAGSELHQALNGDWALLFSHPEDFAPGSVGAQLSLEQTRYELSARGARAIAVQRDQGLSAMTWIDGLQRERQLLQLREPPFAAADPISFAARSLRGELLTLQCRFVLIVDGSLKRRGLLKYSAGRSDVSLADLFASVDALRRPRNIGKAA
jgi:peroxiredoxin (alkyl hydroperoxide reductase subunit C)